MGQMKLAQKFFLDPYLANLLAGSKDMLSFVYSKNGLQKSVYCLSNQCFK